MGMGLLGMGVGWLEGTHQIPTPKPWVLWVFKAHIRVNLLLLT